ncbi:hypothetical protein ACA910_005855 [Epithemia clementina (nom. ined.)]
MVADKVDSSATAGNGLEVLGRRALHKDKNNNLAKYLEETYGMDWQKRPLLLRNLWSAADLANTSRRLSVTGLLNEHMTIPYFSDARLYNALSPDATGPVSLVVANITRGLPHKIGTQFVVQRHPELVHEIAPTEIVTQLFGNYFTPDHVRGTMGPLLPALTTVPLFIASSALFKYKKSSSPKLLGNNEPEEVAHRRQPFTALHCEPIGNVAVQLSGAKQWTLVDPAFSFLIRPSTAPDGRAFFASWKPIQTLSNDDDDDHNDDDDDDNSLGVPFYKATTQAGDAMWVPTWTWHRVDYITNNNNNDNTNGSENDIAIGGSLFHFRPRDFMANNPLFAMLMIPAMILELVGYNTQ